MSHPAEFYKTLLDNLYDGVYFVDLERHITYWNASAERLTGYQSKDVIGKSCSDNILNHCNEDGYELCTSACPLAHSMNTGKSDEAEVFLRHANGHRVPVFVRASPIRDKMGKVVGAVEIFNNNTRVWRARRKIDVLEQKVFLDPLTQLGNRRYLEIHFPSALAEARDRAIHQGLLLIDIDCFKQVNDQHGHNIGDRVLKMVADTLRSNLRDSDIVVRWGGEEIVVLLRDIVAAETIAIAEKLRSLIERSHLPLAESMLRVTVSLGATLLRSDDTLESAIQRADALMYQSKSGGRNRVSFSE